ncbi:hypothetical protein F52700_4118 [Fusarium sp. NRRL 52700]|nr:hypothetical protein F52700_4118 [Fusarium sp. NRRL 52700]
MAAQQPVLTQVLSAMQSSVSKLTTFTKLKGLFDKLPLNLLSDFFDLPDDFPISRQHNRGGCQVFANEDGEKVFKLYIIQTPFYSTGFWSLLLYPMSDRNIEGWSTKLSGVIHVDKDVDVTNIFSNVRDIVTRYGHHQTLLPLQLFVSHYETTKEAFTLIQNIVSEVDDDLFRHLQDDEKLDDTTWILLNSANEKV